MKVIIITIMINLLFTGFTETLKTFLKNSLGFKYSNIRAFYNLLKKFKGYQVITSETKSVR